MRTGNLDKFAGDYTITSLKDNEIFVFGSNLAGRHGAGAARQAHRDFGAEYGVGEGLTGRCYALPTLDYDLERRSRDDLYESIRKFYLCAQRNTHLTFLLTKVGCGLAGYSEGFMRDLFAPMPDLPNVVKPEGWL